MARLAEIGLGQWEQFVRLMHGSGLTAEEAVRLTKHPDVFTAMLAEMRQHLIFRLIHGRFTPLGDKLAAVRKYPGITNEMVDAAIANFEKSELRPRYEIASPMNPFLDAVVTVSRDSVLETLLYARDRMRDTFGDRFEQEEAYDRDMNKYRLRLLEGVPDHRNCVRIEVVNLAHGWNPKQGFLPDEVRSANSASFAVIYAAAQNPEWVRQIDGGTTVPCVIAGGLEFNVRRDTSYALLPAVLHSGRRTQLSFVLRHVYYNNHAMPCIWE